MDFYKIMTLLHAGTGILLFALALGSIMISILIAVRPAVDAANVGFLRKANFVALMEQIALGVVIVTGLIAVFMSDWSLSQLWVWMSLLMMVVYGLILEFATKPARMAVAVGGSAVKVGMQVLLQVGHVLLLIVAFAFMAMKPG